MAIFLVISPAEARRTLPRRLPMLVFAGLAVDACASWWRARGAEAATPPSLDG
jgi:hypothetical protein